MPKTLSPEMKKNTFDKAFKEHAVNLWLGSGKSAREIAQELGINHLGINHLWTSNTKTANTQKDSSTQCP